ncbi:hypothetical protein GN958_ATG15736 [Phytophthora infestans]|uniref:Uncharacterized protein n=1 Tax=Phytophthora infestans TaxID=4787 RepID=A0A8S9U2D1_PHYIN|nr:hypothetical protein GN958_ATG15736 [Phytophthora infestans]
MLHRPKRTGNIVSAALDVHANTGCDGASEADFFASFPRLFDYSEADKRAASSTEVLNAEEGIGVAGGAVEIWARDTKVAGTSPAVSTPDSWPSRLDITGISFRAASNVDANCDNASPLSRPASARGAALFGSADRTGNVQLVLHLFDWLKFS